MLSAFIRIFCSHIMQKAQKKKLQEMSGVSAASIAKLGRGENVTTDILLKICKALDCDISDITEVIKADSTSGAQKGKLSL